MSDNLLFSKKKSEELNQLAQEIDPRLILFCEYTPIEQYQANESGFILGCLNLYKCTVDGLILWSTLRDNNSYLSSLLPIGKLQELVNIHDQQGYLRAIFAHNNSEDACESQASRIVAYKHWLKDAVGVDTLTTDVHFHSALARIEKIGDDLYSILSGFINNVKALTGSARTVAIHKWIDCAAEWYSQKKYHEIYKGWFLSLVRNRVYDTKVDSATVAHELIRNALKKEADEDTFRQIGVPNSLELKRHCDQIWQGQGTEDERKQKIDEFLDMVDSADNDREKEYEAIEKADAKALEIKWQKVLHTQLINRANVPENLTKTNYLSPTYWLDDHVHAYFFYLSPEKRTYKRLVNRPK